MNNKIEAKDLITLGIFTVIYFVIGAALSILVSIPIMVPFFPAVWALVNGTVFMLYSTKVEKFGLVTLMAVLTGLLVGLTGMGFWSVPTGLVFGLLGDLIMKKGNYKSFKHNLLGYSVFSIWTSGSLIPWYFFAQETLAKYAAGGHGTDYGTQVLSVPPWWSLLIFVGLNFICGLLGALIGKKIMKKHFEKAGIL